MSLIKYINLQELGDDRGGLVAIEELTHIPFSLKRVYYIFGTKAGVERGFHAHKELIQMAVCVKGSCTMMLDNGDEKADVKLDSSSKGILIEPMVWHEMRDFSSDCVLLVLASDVYDEADYVRDYNEFLLMRE